MPNHQKEKDLKNLLPSLKNILQKFWPYIQKRKTIISLSFFALLIETALKLLEPWPLKIIFDNLLIANPKPLFGLDIFVLLIFIALGMIGISLLESLAAYWSTYGMALAAIQVLAEVRGDLFSHLQRLSLSFYHKHRSGDLIARVTADIDNMRIVTVKTALPFLTNIVALVGMMGVMLWMNWELALIAIAIVPLLVIFSSRLIGRIRQIARQHRTSQGILASTTSETIGAIKVVQSLPLYGRIESVFSEQNHISLHHGAKSLQLSVILERTVQVSMAFIVALVLWRGAQLVLNKTLTPGDLLVFITYLKNAFEPMRKLANQVGQIAKATASGERVVDILNYEPHVKDLPDAKPAHPFFGVVRFENVSFGYDWDRNILHNVSFEVHPGQQIAVVGASGSGKSTLVSLILRLYDPNSGRILIDGQDLREYTLESLRGQISIVLQDSILFAVSVEENIAYGKFHASDLEIIQAAKLANAHEFIQQLPDSYDTILGERGGTLSGGQRQRIAIARAAVRNAPILILDEPTTGLDSASELAVNQALMKLSQGRTTFLITHNLRMAENANVILYLENGQILEQGTHEELINKKGQYAKLYRLQNPESVVSC